MTEQQYVLYITFETAKLATEKGFTTIVSPEGFYEKSGRRWWYSWENGDEDYICTTQSILQKWLRDVHRIDIHCECNYERDMWTFGFRKKGYSYNHYPLEYKTYEEALESGLQNALNLINK